MQSNPEIDKYNSLNLSIYWFLSISPQASPQALLCFKTEETMMEYLNKLNKLTINIAYTTDYCYNLELELELVSFIANNVNYVLMYQRENTKDLLVSSC